MHETIKLDYELIVHAFKVLDKQGKFGELRVSAYQRSNIVAIVAK
jgi:hypothetical protein